MRRPKDEVAGVQWHRMHKITPLLNAWKAAAALVAIFLWRSSQILEDFDISRTGTYLLIALGVIVVGALLGLLLSTLSWSRTAYGFSDESVFLHSGVLFRQQKHVRIDRIQSIEVTQPLLARIAGFAALTIESAASSEGNLKFEFLKESDAQQLRNDLLARAAGLKLAKQQGIDPSQVPALGEAAPTGEPAGTGAPGTGAPGTAAPGTGAPSAPYTAGTTAEAADPSGAGAAPSSASNAAQPPNAAPAPSNAPPATPNIPLAAPSAPELELVSLDGGRLIGSILRSIGLPLTLLFIVGMVAIAVAAGEAGSLFTVVVPVLGLGAYWWSRFSGEFNFRVATSPDGIRLRRGLLETKSRTIPPGRVQAVQLNQPLLWRRKGWWRITLNVAGRLDSSDAQTDSVFYPAATKAEAQQLLALVVPEVGSAEAWQAVTDGLDGFGEDGGFTNAPARMRILDPLTYRRRGFKMLNSAVMLRDGRVQRTLQIVPYARIQSMAADSGPIDRAKRVVNIHLHSTPGSISPVVNHVDRDKAREFVADLSQRARHARASAGPERWMEAKVQSGPHPKSGSDGQGEADFTQE